MQTNERAGRAVAFDVTPEHTDPRLDNRVSLDDPRTRTLLREIHARGHAIGLHPARLEQAVVADAEQQRGTLAAQRLHQMLAHPTPGCWNANPNVLATNHHAPDNRTHAAHAG